MKKIIYITVTFLLIILTNACGGYKPIFGSSNLKFTINDYEIKGDENLGKQIYSKLYYFSKSNEKNPEAKSFDIVIKVSKEKNATAKDSAGQILEYKINLNTVIIMKDYLTNDEILNSSFDYSSSYVKQDQYTETLKLENKALENLINKTFENLLLKLSENISNK